MSRRLTVVTFAAFLATASLADAGSRGSFRGSSGGSSGGRAYSTRSTPMRSYSSSSVSGRTSGGARSHGGRSAHATAGRGHRGGASRHYGHSKRHGGKHGYTHHSPRGYHRYKHYKHHGGYPHYKHYSSHHRRWGHRSYVHHRHYAGCGHWGTPYLHGFYASPYGFGFGFGYGHGGLSVGFGYGGGLWGGGYYVAPYVAPVVIERRTYIESSFTEPPVEYGQVEIDVKPASATVYVDGELVGIADDFDGWPGRLHLPVGTHDLEIRAPGYEPLAYTLELVANRTAHVAAEMRRAVASRSRAPGSEELKGDSGLLLEVEPPDATVYVDGRLVPAVFDGRLQLELEAGEHKLEVVKPGHQVFTGNVVLHPGQRQDLRVRLRPLPTS